MKRLVTWLKTLLVANGAKQAGAEPEPQAGAEPEPFWLHNAAIKIAEERSEAAEKRAEDYRALSVKAAMDLSTLEQKLRRDFPTVEHDDPKWTADDSETWAHFLATNGVGQKLQALANYHEQATNRSVILRLEGAENNTGFARGWHMATAYFFKTLSAEVRPQQDQNDTQQGDDASRLRERVAP